MTEKKTMLGILMALMACFLLSVMNAVVKFLTLQGYPMLQITFFTGLIGFVCVAGWMAWKKNLGQVKTSDPLMAVYTISSVGAGFSLFYAFGTGKLAEISTIVGAAPLMIAALSYFFLHERLRPLQGALVFLGFFGILLVFKPRPELLGYGVFLIAVLGTFLFSLSQIVVRKLRDSVTTLAFTFYFYLGFFAIAGIFMHYQPIALADAPFFLLTGACDVISLILLYSAFKYTEASVIGPFQYSSVLWTGLFGYLVWHEMPDVWTLMGAAIIAGAGIAFTRTSINDPR